MMSRRNIIIAVSVCVVAVIGAALFFTRPQVDKIDINRGEPSQPPASAPQVMTKVINEDTSSYSVQFEYPQLQGIFATGVRDKINNSISTGVHNQVAGFHSDNASNSSLGDPELKSSLDGSFDTSLLNSAFFSALMSYSNYSAWAAHPNSYNVALNYNLKTGEAVALDQLLRGLNPSVGYMDRLAQYAKKDLVRQFGNSQDSLEAINFGAAPNPENYANYTLDAAGLSLRFDPYQVAPYAAGSPTVKIPYSDLLSVIIKPVGGVSATSSAKWWLDQ